MERKKTKMKNKLLYILIAIVIIAGIVVGYTAKFKFSLAYDDSIRVEMYIGKDYTKADVEAIAKEAFGTKEVLIQKIEFFNDSVAITVRESNDEKLNNLVAKVNEKYGTTLAKEELVDPQEFSLRAAASGDFAKRKQAEIYREYQEALRRNNALDFDDLIVKTVELFKTDDQVLDYYQERFRYIMVDEYQDTNTAQFELISILARKYKNLCVVGDDDQSIYKFRGANIYNILNFEKHFPEAVTIKLEQNYRSTQNILNAANGVISNNMGRKRKTLWTDNEEGKKIGFKQFETGYEEAEYVAKDINACVKDGRYHYGDCAVLYRTNAQSRLFEEKFIVSNIPYKIVGGVNFYARKEIKDLLAYLKTIDNARDDLAVRRIINVPKRGIGATTLNRVADYAAAADISFYNALKMADDIPTLGKSAAKIKPFVNFIQVMRSKVEIISVSELLQEIIDETGYVKELEAEDTEEAKARIENIDELISKVVAVAASFSSIS